MVTRYIAKGKRRHCRANKTAYYRSLLIMKIDKFKELLIRVLQVVCDIHTEGECLVFEYNKVDYGNMLYEFH